MTTKLYRGDCLTEMDKIADRSVNAIIADWPYGTTADQEQEAPRE